MEKKFGVVDDLTLLASNIRKDMCDIQNSFL
jgi:hypothetical protein